MVELFALDIGADRYQPDDDDVRRRGVSGGGRLYLRDRCERLSFDGINKAIDQMERARTSRQTLFGRDSRILGIIPNKIARAPRTVHRYNIGQAGRNGIRAWSGRP